MQEVAGKRVTVFGLGRFGGGIAVTRWLVEQGADVLVVDEEPSAKLVDSIAQLSDLPVRFVLGNPTPQDFSRADLLVASPAIPPSNKFMNAARAAAVPVTTEIRLFIERCPAQIFGVTGTKGKSTTTAMLGAMLARRFTTQIGGNIGGSLLASLPKMTAADRVVLELSSYMLEHLGTARWSPRVALVTMLGSDHLAWHGSREAYVSAKKNLLRFQHSDDDVVLNGEDSGAAALATEAVGRVSLYSLSGCRPFSLRMPGRHNQLNAQGAFTAARLAGITWEEAQAALADFPGLPHRLQLVHEADGVRWYNDSIATIPAAAVAALESFEPGSVIQIIGGQDKHLAIDGLVTALNARAKAILCIGSTGPMLAGAMRGERTVLECGDLPAAVAQARRVASAGDIILLSPGYPSYDQFVNFEQRGETFTRLARQVP